MAEFHEVPVVEVHSENIKEIWPSLVLAIKTSTFIAIDTELSGLGERKSLFAKSIDDRYKAMCDVAKTRSIIALGISCFKLQPRVVEGSGEGVDIAVSGQRNNPRRLAVNFVIQTFNIFVLCNDNYIVEPLSLRFLIEHGFDFNMQYSKGLPYTSGNDKPSAKNEPLRLLFTEIALSRVPVVLHNALVDLVFLYQSLYAAVPTTLSSFVTDLSQIFGNGIYDTKYIAEFKARLPASFLEYSFRKCQRGNCLQASNNQPFLDVSFLSYHESMQKHTAVLSCGLRDQPCERDVGKTKLCEHFAGHGWCQAGNSCPNSHDVDMILDSEDIVSSKKTKKRAKKSKRTKHSTTNGSTEDVSMSDNMQDDSSNVQSSNEELVESSAVDSILSMQLDESTDNPCIPVSSETDASSEKAASANRSGGHRAGFDAFMTGYVFASFVAKYGCVVDGKTDRRSLGEFGVAEELGNRVYLGGKDFPLQISQSSFAKPSKCHLEKWERLNSVVAEH